MKHTQITLNNYNVTAFNGFNSRCRRLSVANPLILNIEYIRPNVLKEGNLSYVFQDGDLSHSISQKQQALNHF